MPTEIENLKYKIKGIRALILIKDREIAFSEFDDARTERLLHSIFFLIGDIKEVHDFKGMMIEATHGKFFIFNRKNQFLGVLSDTETNFPFLKLLVRKVLSTNKKNEKKEVETPPEDEIPYFLRLSCSDYYKRYPEE